MVYEGNDAAAGGGGGGEARAAAACFSSTAASVGGLADTDAALRVDAADRAGSSDLNALADCLRDR